MAEQLSSQSLPVFRTGEQQKWPWCKVRRKSNHDEIQRQAITLPLYLLQKGTCSSEACRLAASSVADTAPDFSMPPLF
jgi:hypothetical protein